MESRESDIVKDILQGNRERFREIVKGYQNLVAMIVSQLTPSREEIIELSQEVFVKVYQNLHHFRGESKFSTWISRIAYNTTLNHLKKKKAITFIDFFGEGNENGTSRVGEESLVSNLPTPEELVKKKETGEILRQAIQQIPEQYRVILLLYHRGEFSYEEIAEITQLPLGTVKNYLHRARNYLKDILIKQFTREEFQP